jgi:hypothetical protein
MLSNSSTSLGRHATQSFGPWLLKSVFRVDVLEKWLARMVQFDEELQVDLK